MIEKPGNIDKREDLGNVSRAEPLQTDPELKAELDTLAEIIRSPVSEEVGGFAREPDCQRMVEMVAAMGPAQESPQTGRAGDEATTPPSEPNGSQPPGSTATKTLGRYELLDKLGEGGMGAVYRARHSRLNKLVALKVLTAGRLDDPSALARFDREMQAVGQLAHPNIVAAHDAGEDEGTHYLAMELVDGPDVSTLAKQLGPMPVADACEIVRQAAVGLAHAHEHGMVHRDIKPSNLMVTPDGQVKVLDLGLALLDKMHHPGGIEELTSSGQLMGTLDYMAPEQGSDSHQVDIRADVYSLGATLYKLLCGTAPFAGPRFDTPVKKLMALATENPESIDTRCAAIPAELTRLVHSMLDRNPDHRPATPSDVAAALTPLAEGSDLATLVSQVTGDPIPADATSRSTAGGLRSSLSETSPPSPSLAEVPAELPSTQPQPVRRRVRPVWIATAAGFFGLLALGIILSLRTSDGTVTVETPDGRLPDDVKLILSGDGQQAEITSTDQWKIDISPGVYKAELHGGGDQFAIENNTITVTRAGKTILTVRRTPAPEPPIAKVDLPRAPPIPPAPKPPKPVAHPSGHTDADVLARLANVDWQPSPADDKLRGVVASPAAIDGIPGSWQIRHGCGYYHNDRQWLSPKGNYILLSHGDDDSTAVVFETKTGQPVGAIPAPNGGEIISCSWSGDETRIVYSIRSSRAVHVASRDGVSEHFSFRVPSGVDHLSWSPDSSKIVIGAWQSFAVYSATGELLRSYDQKVRWGLEWSSDGRFIMVNDGDSVPVVELATGKVICEMGKIEKVGYRWSSDGHLLIALKDGAPKPADAGSSDSIIRFVSQHELYEAMRPDGQLSVNDKGEIRDVVGKVRAKLDLIHAPGNARFFWDEPDRIRVVSSNFPGYWAEYSPTGRMLDSGQRPLWMQVPYGTWLKDEERITTAHSGNELAGKNGRQFFWSVDGTEDASVELARGSRYIHYGILWGVPRPLFNPITGVCAFAQLDGSNNPNHFVFDREGQIVSQCQFYALSSSFSPDGSLLALFHRDGHVAIRREGETVHRLEGFDRGPAGLSWNADGSHLCGWNFQGTVCVWDVRDGTLVEQREGMVFGWGGIWNHRFSAPRWSPDGTRVAMFSKDMLHIVAIGDGEEDVQLDWDGKCTESPIYWTPDGTGLLVDGKIYGLDGQQIGTLEGANRYTTEFQWLDAIGGAVGVHWNVLFWPSIEERPVEIPLPGARQRSRIRPKDQGDNVQQVSPSGRYFATIAVQEYPAIMFAAGDLVLVDLQERKVVWTGIGYDDGAMIRVGESGEILTGPDDIDRYLIYTIRYPEGVVVAMTQLQFAARIGLSPAGQCMQRILDFGGKLQLAGRDEPLVRTDLADARELPKPSEVIGVSLAGSHFITGTGLEPLKDLPSLATLDLSSATQVKDVDLAFLRDLTHLQTLNLAHTQVTNTIGAVLPESLEQLDLTGTAIDDLLLSELRNFKSLRRATLTGTKVTPEGIESLRKALPDYEVIFKP